MRARVLAIVLASLVGGCTDSEFLRGAECGNDRDCGRSLSCEHGVCGGCPPQVLLVDGRCPCPGERVLECRQLADASRCMPVCPLAPELCEVVEVIDGVTVELPLCLESSSEPCFEVELGASGCPEGQARIHLQPEDASAVLVVNCPPPESDESRFDCEPP